MSRQHSRRNAPGGRHASAGGGIIQPMSRSHAVTRPLTFSEARDGEQSQYLDIGPEVIDGGVHAIPGTFARDLFDPTVSVPAIVTVLPTLPDADYPVGSLVFLTSDQKLYRNPDDVDWSSAVDAEDIVINKITAGQLASVLVLASLIQTADEGARCEMDVDGFRVYSSSDEVLINMPTNGEAIYIKADVVATTLTVTGETNLQGASAVAMGAVLTAQATVVKPTQAPTLTQGWDSETMPIDAAVDKSATRYTRQGLAYDAAGGAGGATKVFWTVAEDSAGEQTLVELLASDRTVNRSVGLGADILNVYHPSVVRHSSWVYIYYSDFGGGRHVQRYLASTLAFVDDLSVTLPGDAARPWDHQICSDGTNPYIVGPTEFGEVKWNKYNDTMVKQGSTISTGSHPASDVFVGAVAGSADIGAFRIFALAESGHVYVYDSAGSRQSNEEFDTPGPSQSPGNSRGLTYGDALGDGARFWSLGNVQNNTVQTLGKHSTWTWTTDSSIYWVAYSWYDDVGTTHETEVGPRSSITMGRRKKMTVTAASLPGSGGADEPNKHRAYMFPKATAPATTELKLQNAFADNVTVERTYDNGGAAPQTTNGFSALGTAAEIKSATTGWSLKGDGTAFFKAVAHIMFKNSNQSIATGTASFTKVASYDGTTRTNSAYYSNTTGVITLLQAGLYKIDVQMAFAANATGQRFVGIGINGADPTNRNRVSQNANGAGGTHLAFSMFLDAAANDTIQVMVEQSSGGNLNVTDGIFHIAYVGV